jgi:hypothetical protein
MLRTSSLWGTQQEREGGGDDCYLSGHWLDFTCLDTGLRVFHQLRLHAEEWFLMRAFLLVQSAQEVLLAHRESEHAGRFMQQQ